GGLAHAASDAILDELAADIEQPRIFHARGAGRFAGAAGEAAIEMQLRARAGRCAFEHRLDQIDASARTVELVAEELVGRAGGVAESAVHALAQYRFRLASLGRISYVICQVRLHSRAGERRTATGDRTRQRQRISVATNG